MLILNTLIFSVIGRTDAEAETPILWPPDVKNWLTEKDPDAGKDWRQEEKGTTEEEMVGWHHRLNGHEFEQTLGDGDGQGSLVCYSSWDRKESDMTQQLNNNTSLSPLWTSPLINKESSVALSVREILIQNQKTVCNATRQSIWHHYIENHHPAAESLAHRTYQKNLKRKQQQSASLLCDLESQ